MPEEPTKQELTSRINELESEMTDRRIDYERLERILSSLDTGLSLINPDRTIAWVNSKILEMFPDGNPIGQICHRFYESSDEPCEPCPTFQCFNSGKVHRFEKYNAAEKKWYSIISQPIKDLSGKVVNVLEGVTDITERKEAEQATSQERNFLNRIMETSPVGITLVDREGHISLSNARAEKILGLKRSDILNRSYNDPAWHITDFEGNPYPDDKLPFQLVWRKASPVFGVEHAIVWSDGKRVLLSINAAPLFDNNGNFNGMVATIENVTDRKMAEKALKESEEKYRDLIVNAQDIIYSIDLEGTFLEVNDAFLREGGWAKEDIIGNNFMTMLHPEDTQIALEAYEKGKDGQIAEFEMRAKKKDGSFSWYSFVNRPLTDKNGKMVGVNGIARNIDERKQAEEALRESEEKLRTIIEHSNELFYIRDTKRTLTYVSQTSKDLFGYTPEEMMIKWTQLATDNPINQKGIEAIEKAIATGEKQAPYLLELQKKDGTLVWVEINESPVKDATGKVVAISGAARNVTEQKRTEQRLLKSEKGFRDLFDSITDLIYTQDLDGRFISVNHALSTLFGYERDELIGRRASDFMKPKMRPFFESDYLENIKTKGYHEGITVYFAKNGEKIYIDYRSSLVDPDDGEPYISGTGRDVTERVLSQTEIKRLQNQIHQSQKMEAIGLMAGGVAHDLNNILSGIVSYPELLLIDLPEDSPLRKPIKTMQESGMRAADVVADLLTIARGVATGKEVLNLNTIVTEYLGSAEHQKLGKTHAFVSFKTELNPDLLNMSGSPTHIKKSLMNLVTNASEAIEGSGVVTISTLNRYLDEPLKGYEDVRMGEYAVLTVSDNGSGILPRDLERIFEPFYTKKMMGRSGTGLGLAVVWNTVQDHNGYIDVKSTDTGTVFELYFPVTREELADEKEQIPLKDYLGHGEKILVVDDEERQREIACGMLAKLGYTAEAVSSGEAAIEYVKENPVDLIVLDMVMPKGINGRETYEEIIKIHPGQKAIIASGYAKTREVETAQELGAGRYIRKPYTLENIGTAVKKELEKQAVSDF